MKLTKESFRKAASFVTENARPLDRAFFDFYFNKGRIDSVVAELQKYQNPDGGFGHGIEPDMRLKASSPFATSVGLQYCIDLGLKSDSPVVRHAIEYLVSTFDTTHHFWVYSYENVNDEPHAPWWHVENLEPPTEEKWPNVSAENVGYLNRYSEHVPKEILAQANQRAQQNLESYETIPTLYDYMCWQRAAPYLPDSIKSLAMRKLVNTAEAIIDDLDEKMGEIRIFWLVPYPDSPLMKFKDAVYELFEADIATQREDGGWWPTWAWGQYEEVWPIAEKEWAGKMTTKCLIVLKRHSLIQYP